MQNVVEELRWRGMIQDTTHGAEERLNSGPVTVYAGFDPTAESLQIGNLVAIMLLVHFQRAGHTPIALVGGATGMIGDPSGKTLERSLQSIDTIKHNVERFKVQLRKFIDFDREGNAAELVDNYDWLKEFSLLAFLRDVGKHLTVNYMTAKDSVQQRLQTGLSFTEFSYQLLQAYDFYHLYTQKNCVCQIGGSDQWGNITAGTELIRRIGGGEAHALTCPLITKADGTKFGKSEAGQKIWLDPTMTSPYKFYQFWLNCSDQDAGRFIRIFSLLSREEIEALEKEQAQAPHLRVLQKALAKDITIRVHSESEYQKAVDASEILFGKATEETLKGLSEQVLLDVFEGVPQFTVAKTELEQGINIVDLLTEKASVFPSKGEARRMLKSGGVSINKTKVENQDAVIGTESLIDGKYVLVQKGKKNYYLLRVVGS